VHSLINSMSNTLVLCMVWSISPWMLRCMKPNGNLFFLVFIPHVWLVFRHLCTKPLWCFKQMKYMRSPHLKEKPSPFFLSFLGEDWTIRKWCLYVIKRNWMDVVCHGAVVNIVFVAGMMNGRMLKLLVLLNLDVLQARYALAARGSIYLIMLL